MAVTRGDHPPSRSQPREQGVLAVRARRRRYRVAGPPFAVNIAPMIDVTFLLLIFFLVTTTFERAEGILASRLPKDTGLTPAVALPISPIIVHLSQVGPEGDDYAIRIDNFQNVPANFIELAEYFRQIQQWPGFDEETPVIIVASDAVRWDHVVGAWNAAVRAGCKNIAFGVR